ncbi:MAG TPA: DUF6585 family protein [Cyanophyceae cyanobacterium]
MNVYQVARANQFGNLVEKHRAQTGTYIIFTVISLLLGAFLLLIAIHGIPLWGGWRLTSIWFLVFGLFFAIATCYFGITAIATIGVRLFLFEQGLIYKNFAASQIVPYDSMTVIWNGRLPAYADDTSAATEKIYKIETNSGKRLKITDIFDKVDEIGDRLQKELVRHQLPRVLNDYNRGRELQFGTLMINHDGVSSVLGTLPWTEIKTIQIRTGVVVFEGNSGTLLNWMTVRVAEIPNLCLFLALAEQILKGDRAWR